MSNLTLSFGQGFLGFFLIQGKDMSGFTLRCPFRLGPNYELGQLPVGNKLNGIAAELQKVTSDSYAILLNGFDSEKSAQEFIPKMWFALSFASLRSQFPLTVNYDLDRVRYYDKPIEADSNNPMSMFGQVDGFANNNGPIIFPTKKDIVIGTIPGGMKLAASQSGESFLQALTNGLKEVANVSFNIDMRFKTALDLHNAYYYLHSSEAKLITLMMSLESLSEPKQKYDIALELITKWRDELNKIKSAFSEGSPEFLSLKSLEHELLFRKSESHRSSIRQLVYDTLKSSGNSKAEEMTKRAVEIYDDRGTLVHEGKLEHRILVKDQIDALEIVHSVLEARLRLLLK